MLVVAVVTACAVAAGTVGAASAGGLTHKAVRKIAAKAIKKAAPGLSVAHAATADNANLVGGLSAASLQTSVREYVVPPTTGSALTSQKYDLPGLAPGTYLVSYSLVLDFTTDTGLGFCELLLPPATTHIAESVPATGTFTRSCSATTVLEVPAGAAPVLSVSAAATTFKVAISAFPSTVTFTRVDSLTSAGAVAQ